MGPLFGKEGLYMAVTGSASRLSFGGTALFTLAVQFCPQPSAARTSVAAAPAGGAREASSARGHPMALLSKFHSGLRGEFRLGLDAQLRPFFHREVWSQTRITP